MFINDRGQKIYRGQEAIDEGMRRLREGRKLHYKTTFQNLPISIENRKGSVRSGKDKDGDEWRTKYKIPYGYIPGTRGVDGDELDVFVGGDENSAFAYVVHCNTPDGSKFDEDKVMLGFSSSKSAKQCFLQHYDSPKFFGGIDAIPMWQFRERVWKRKHTTKKLVASRNGLRESFNARVDTLGRGTDQIMRKSILGKNIMSDPNVRESDEGGPGSGPHKNLDKEIDNLVKTYDIIKDPEGRKVIARRLDKVRDKLLNREADEHGVAGQKWGIRHARNDGAGQKGFQAKYRALANDPKTMNMMQVVHRSQAVLDAIAHRNKLGDPKQPQQPNQKPKTTQENHGEALDALKELGWKALEVGARLTGTEGTLGVIRSIVKSPNGQKLVLNTDKAGNHKLTTDKQGKIPASKPHQPKKRMKASMREAKTYFARSLATYGSEREADDVDLIKESFGGKVSFPKTRRHAELGMGYFHKKIDAAKRVVLKPARKNRLTAGVFSEAVHALKRKIPVYAIRKGKMRRVHSVEALNNPNQQGHFGRIVFKKG